MKLKTNISINILYLVKMEDSDHHSASDTDSSSTSTIISSSSKYSDASIVKKDDRIRALDDAGRCPKSTSKNVYRKGRKFHGNRYTKKGSSTKEKKRYTIQDHTRK